jgi:SnoaL-like domain
MTKNTLIGIVACVLAASGLAASRRAAAAHALTALDYAEIQQLYARYNYGSDTAARDGYMYADTFTPDGEVLILPDTTIRGREELAKFIRRSDKGPTTIHHFTSNLLIEPSDHGARGAVYLLLANIGQDQEPSAVVGGGVYYDQLTKTSDGWRFKKRTYVRANGKVPLEILEANGLR